MKPFVILILLFSHYLTSGQQKVNNQFDFWIGEWDIEQLILDKDGSWLNYSATTKVEPILKGTMLVEYWSGCVKFFWENMQDPEILEGYSLRYFDEREGQWLIFWMDSRTQKMAEPFKGIFIREGYGEFFKFMETSNGTRTSKITFEEIDRNHVLWKLATSTDKENWTDIWIMKMKRR